MSTIKEHVRILRSDQTLLSGNEPTFPIPDHAETHEISGGDEIEHDKIDGSGTNTHAQIDSFMTAHAARHKLGGADPIDLIELNDVTTTLLTDHDFLYWETASGLWKNKALVAGDANLSDLGVQGFVDLTESTIGYNDSTYTFTITDAGSGWSYWRDGVKHTISGNKSVVLPGTPPAADTYYIYIDATDGTLTASTSIWTLEDTKVLVAILEWNNASTPKYFLADERHQSFFPQRAHWHHHFTEGTELKSGGALSGYTVAPASPADTDNTFGISAAEIVDEDLLHTLGALADPGGSGTDYLAYYRTGSATWAWEQSPVPFRYTAAGYIQYDNAGTMTQGQNAKFYNWYLCLTNYDGQPRHLLIPGNSEFGSALAAYAEGISDLDLSGFDPQELIFAYQLTFQTSAAYTTKGKCRLTRDPEPINAARIVASTSGGSIDHNTLAGLQGGNGTDEFYHLSALRYGFITDTQILAPNGAVGTPSYSFASDPDTGFYRVDSGIIRVSCNNSNTAYFSAGTLTLQSGVNLSLASGGDIVSTNNGDIDIIPNGTGIVKIGAGTPGHLTPTSGELYVQGKAEFDGIIYADGSILSAGYVYGSSANFTVGSNDPTNHGAIRWYASDQTVDTSMILTGAVSNAYVVCEYADRAYDFAHPLQANPTLYIQSANQSATEWLSLTHNQTNGLISAGTGLKLTSGNNGNITLDPNGTGIISAAANIQFADDIGVEFGSSQDAYMEWNTDQTNDVLMIGLGATNELILCEKADMGIDLGSSTLTHPSLRIQSANAAIDTNEFVRLSHNGDDLYIYIGVGGKRTKHERPIELADDGSMYLPSGTSGYCVFIVGDDEEHGRFFWDSSGNLTTFNLSTNVVTTDTDTKFCVINGANPVELKNRLGSAKNVMIIYDYA